MTKEELNALLDERVNSLKSEFSAQVEGIKSELEAEKTKSADLETKLEAATEKIAKLEATPAEEHTSGETTTTTLKQGLGPAHAALKAKWNLP